MTTIDLPIDTKPSRLDRGHSSAPTENPDDLATVDAKVAAFWKAYPDGAIDASDIEQLAPGAWRVTAYVWKETNSGRADSSASAVRVLELDSHASGEFPLESAQTIAIGRALRFLGIIATQNGESDG